MTHDEMDAIAQLMKGWMDENSYVKWKSDVFDISNKSLDICIEGITEHGLALKHIPEEHRSICEAILKLRGE